MSEKVRCSQGHENDLGGNFCTFCGERLSGGPIKCPFCGEALDSSANFCGKCGKPLREAGPADIHPMLWQRGSNDFATRVDIEDLPGVLKKGVIVEPGTKALLLINGALAEILQPGGYDLGGMASKLEKFEPYRMGTAILVDSGDVEIQLNITGIFTKDPLNIDVVCKVISQVEDPALFFNHVMKGRRNYLTSELRSALYDEMQNAFNEAVGKKTVVDLNRDLPLKRQFEVSVENHLRATFQRWGLNFNQLRTIDYRFKGYDKVRGMHEEVYLLVSEDEAKLRGRKRLFDVFDQGQIQEILEETRKADHFEKRIEIWEKLRQLANSDKMNEGKNTDDLEGFIHEIDKGKMLRADEIEALKNSFAQSGMRREFLLKKIDLDQEIEYEGMRLVGKEEVELRRFEVETERKRRAFEEELKNIMEKAKTDSAVRDLEREAEQKDLDMGLGALKRIKEIKIQEKPEELGTEIDHLKALLEKGIEALITASGEEQARILAGLKNTEMLKGMSEEQILALEVKDSPALIKAFEEKFKALSMEKQEQLYKEMMADKDKSMKIMQEMFNKSLEMQRDVSVAAVVARPPAVVYPPPGQPGSYSAPVTPVSSAGAEVIICPKCKTKVLTGEKYCTNCGNEMP
jgi:hypothetical protein